MSETKVGPPTLTLQQVDVWCDQMEKHALEHPSVDRLIAAFVAQHCSAGKRAMHEGKQLIGRMASSLKIAPNPGSASASSLHYTGQQLGALGVTWEALRNDPGLSAKLKPGDYVTAGILTCTQDFAAVGIRSMAELVAQVGRPSQLKTWLQNEALWRRFVLDLAEAPFHWGPATWLAAAPNLKPRDLVALGVHLGTWFAADADLAQRAHASADQWLRPFAKEKDLSRWNKAGLDPATRHRFLSTRPPTTAVPRPAAPQQPMVYTHGEVDTNSVLL